MPETYDSAKLAVALRTVRTALGLSQAEMAQKLGLSKTTITRAELMEGSLKAQTFVAINRFLQESGIALDFLSGDHIAIRIDSPAILSAAARLEDEGRRRNDRRITVQPQSS